MRFIVGYRYHPHAVHYDLKRRDTEALTWFQRSHDQHVIAVNSQDLDFALAQSIFPVNHEDVVLIAHRVARNDDDVFHNRALDLGLHEQTNREGRLVFVSRFDRIGICDPRDYVHHAALRVNFALGAYHGPVPGVFLACEPRAQMHGGELDVCGHGMARKIEVRELVIRDRQANLRVVGCV